MKTTGKSLSVVTIKKVMHILELNMTCYIIRDSEIIFFDPLLD